MSKDTNLAIIPPSQDQSLGVVATSYEPRHEPARLNDADVKAYEKERRLIHRANARASAKLIVRGEGKAPSAVQVAQEYLFLTGDK